MSGVGHKHLRFSDVGHLILGDHFLMQLLAFAFYQRIALAFLIFPLYFILAHHVLLVELPFLEKPVRSSNDAEYSRRRQHQISGGGTQQAPHIAYVTLRNTEQARQVVGENDVHGYAEYRHFNDILQELHGVLDGKNLLEPFARADVVQLGQGGLDGEHHAHLRQVGA